MNFGDGHHTGKAIPGRVEKLLSRSKACSELSANIAESCSNSGCRCTCNWDSKTLRLSRWKSSSVSTSYWGDLKSNRMLASVSVWGSILQGRRFWVLEVYLTKSPTIVKISNFGQSALLLISLLLIYFNYADEAFQTLPSTSRPQGIIWMDHPYLRLGELINSCVEFKMKLQKSELAFNIVQSKFFTNQWLFESHKKPSEVHPCFLLFHQSCTFAMADYFLYLW